MKEGFLGGGVLTQRSPGFAQDVGPAPALPAPSALPGCAPHTPLSSAGPSAAGPWPAPPLPRLPADSRTACREGAEVSGRRAGTWGRACAASPEDVPGHRWLLPPPSPIPKLVTPQEPRQFRTWLSCELSTHGLRGQRHDPHVCLHQDHCHSHAPPVALFHIFFKLGLPSLLF